MTTFSSRLQHIMELKHVTQYDLARLTGTTQGNISYILNEGRSPRVDLAARIARALDVELDWLCGLTRREGDALDAEERLMLDAFRRLDRLELRRAAIEAVRAMARAR